MKIKMEYYIFSVVQEAFAIDKEEVFENNDVMFLIGAFKRNKEAEYFELLKKKGKHFLKQRKALSNYAKPTVQVLVA
jgi:malate/lactate dehydrogenase